MKPEKILLITGIAVAGILALKYMKQVVYLSFTLLSIKVVWMALLVIFIIASIKKGRTLETAKKKRT
jgi:hypothetical protein